MAPAAKGGSAPTPATTAEGGGGGGPGATDVLAEALAALHVLVLRRQFEVIAEHPSPPGTLVRAREAVWCLLEAQLAHLRGERVTQKDLLALSRGLISPASLSRALADAVEAGALVLRPDPSDARLRRVEPTEAAMATLRARARGGFDQAAALVDGARARLASLNAAPVEAGRVPDAGPTTPARRGTARRPRTPPGR